MGVAPGFGLDGVAISSVGLLSNYCINTGP